MEVPSINAHVAPSSGGSMAYICHTAPIAEGLLVDDTAVLTQIGYKRYTSYLPLSVLLLLCWIPLTVLKMLSVSLAAQAILPLCCCFCCYCYRHYLLRNYMHYLL